MQLRQILRLYRVLRVLMGVDQSTPCVQYTLIQMS